MNSVFLLPENVQQRLISYLKDRMQEPSPTTKTEMELIILLETLNKVPGNLPTTRINEPDVKQGQVVVEELPLLALLEKQRAEEIKNYFE